MTVRFLCTLTIVALLTGGAASLAEPQQNTANAELEVLHIRGPIYAIFGAGGNVTASVGPDGVLLVDTGLAQNTDKLLATIQSLQKQVATNGIPEMNYAAETRS